MNVSQINELISWLPVQKIVNIYCQECSVEKHSLVSFALKVIDLTQEVYAYPCG